MGNSPGHSSEVETVKEKKETPSCCELKRRKSKSKGPSPDEQDQEKTEELFLGNVLKDSYDTILDTDSNPSPTQDVKEVNVTGSAASDDNNPSPTQDGTEVNVTGSAASDDNNPSPTQHILEVNVTSYVASDDNKPSPTQYISEVNVTSSVASDDNNTSPTQHISEVNVTSTVASDDNNPSPTQDISKINVTRSAASDDNNPSPTQHISEVNVTSSVASDNNNPSPTQHISEVIVFSSGAPDDTANNNLSQQDITNLKLGSNVSYSPECLYRCGEREAKHFNDATYKKEGATASNHANNKLTLANDIFNFSVLHETTVKMESIVPVQSDLALPENTGNAEHESGTISNTCNICLPHSIIPETNDTTMPIIVCTQHKSCHIKSSVASDSSLPTKLKVDCIGPCEKLQATRQLENRGASNVQYTLPDSTAIHSNFNHTKETLELVTTPLSTLHNENQGACGSDLTAVKLSYTHFKSNDNLALDEKHEKGTSSCECKDVKKTEIWKATPYKICDKDIDACMIKAQDGLCEEDFQMAQTISSMSPITENLSAVHQKELESQEKLLKSMIEQQVKQISQNKIDYPPCANPDIQGAILSENSSTIKSDTSTIEGIVNESYNIEQVGKENVLQGDAEKVSPLEGNGFSEKQDSDSLKEFEETELLCLSDVEETSAVQNRNNADFGQPTIPGLGDREGMLGISVLLDKDEPKAEESSFISNLNSSDKLESFSKLQYSYIAAQDDFIKHKASKKVNDMDQNSRNWKDSSPNMQYQINSETNNEEQYLHEEDSTFNHDVNQINIAKSEEPEDGTVPPPTPSSMAIWQEEDASDLEKEESEVPGDETHKGQIQQIVSEFGDIVCRRLSLLLESQSLLSITDDNDNPVCENVYFASDMDENEHKYNEDIAMLSQDNTKFDDEINVSLNAGKEKLDIVNSKQKDGVITLSETYKKSDEKLTVDITDVGVRHDKRLCLTGEKPTCNNSLSHFKLASESSDGNGYLNYVVSLDRIHSFDERDNSPLKKHAKKDLEEKETDGELLESSDMHSISFSGADNKPNYSLQSNEKDGFQIMNALDEVISAANSQVFATEKEESILKVVVENITTHMTDQIEDETDSMLLKINEITSPKNERKEHHDGKPTKNTLNPAAETSVLVKSNNDDLTADDLLIFNMERNNPLSLNTVTQADSVTMHHDFRDVESNSADTSTTLMAQESILLLKIQNLEELYARAQTMDEIGDRTPTAEYFPELTALTELASADVDSLVQYQHNGRLSASRTESDLDISEQRDDLSTEGMYADDEDDETMEILFTRTYTEPKQGTEAFVSCTVVNSAFRQAKRDDSFFKYAVPDTLDLLEGSIEVMPPSFIKAKKEMRDIQVHLQSLRKQMEHFHDDIDESSLPNYLSAEPLSRRAITD